MNKSVGVSDADLVLALGPGWVACADALPWSDQYSQLRYAVYSPPYCGDIFICQFEIFGASGSWWHEEQQVGISGVTHWRLAKAGEQDFRARSRQLPGEASAVDQQALGELRRWWKWFVEHQGIDL